MLKQLADIPRILCALVGLSAGPAFAYDFYGPASPTPDQCSQHFDAVRVEIGRDTDKGTRDCELRHRDSVTRTVECRAPYYAGAVKARELLSSGRDACYARAKSKRDADSLQASIAEQNEANARNTQQMLERQRVTVIPVQPAPQPQRQVTRPVVPTPNSRSEEKVQAFGSLMGALLAKSFEQRVEAGTGTEGEANTTSRRAEEYNAKAFRIFEEARTRLKVHPVIAEIQNALFEQLQNQVRVITEQLSTVDKDIREILSDTRTADRVSAAPNTVKTRVPIALTEKEKPLMDYQGQLDEKGRPHGLGAVQGFQDSVEIRYFGQFESGAMTGWGTFVEANQSNGVTLTTQGMFKNGNSVGNFQEITAKSGVQSIYHGPEYEDKEKVVGRIVFPGGNKYEGELRLKDGQLRPFGTGVFVSRNNDTTVAGYFHDLVGETVVMEEGRTTTKCAMALMRGGKALCQGGTRIDYPDGSYLLTRKHREVPPPNGSVYFRPAIKANQGFVDEYMGRIDSVRDLRRRTWSNGYVYEGEFRNDAWGESTIGTLTKPNESRQVGKFVARDLVDGFESASDGTKKSIGAGTEYAMPQVASN